MRTKGGGKVEEYQLGLKIQLTDIDKKRLYNQQDRGCYRIANPKNTRNGITNHIDKLILLHI